MAEDGREAGRRGWVQAAMAWFFGPQQEQQRWQQRVWQSGGLEGQPTPVEDATQRQAEILAQARAAEPPRDAVPLLATAQTPPHMAETERILAVRLAIIQDAIVAEQQRRQQGRGRW